MVGDFFIGLFGLSLMGASSFRKKLSDYEFEQEMAEYHKKRKPFEDRIVDDYPDLGYLSQSKIDNDPIVKYAEEQLKDVLCKSPSLTGKPKKLIKSGRVENYKDMHEANKYRALVRASEGKISYSCRDGVYLNGIVAERNRILEKDFLYYSFKTDIGFATLISELLNENGFPYETYIEIRTYISSGKCKYTAIKAKDFWEEIKDKEFEDAKDINKNMLIDGQYYIQWTPTLHPAIYFH